MKVLKSISLFFLYPAVMFILGMWSGIELEHFFYPEEPPARNVRTENVLVDWEAETHAGTDTETAQAVSSTGRNTLSADTEYVLLEEDIALGTEVETTWRLPGHYIGMTREQFLVAIENYSSYPPLSEMERGFVNAEVVQFSRERVTVRKRYQSAQPDEIFYLAVEDHEVVVYLEDRATLYMNTGIMLDDLPEDMQLKIMQMLYIEGEEALYGFLETYSS